MVKEIVRKPPRLEEDERFQSALDPRENYGPISVILIGIVPSN